MTVTLNQFFAMSRAKQRAFVASLPANEAAALARDAFNFAKQALQSGRLSGPIGGFNLGSILGGLSSIAGILGPALNVVLPGAGLVLSAVSSAAGLATQVSTAFRGNSQAAPQQAPQPQPQAQPQAKDNTALYVVGGIVLASLLSH